ncbi:partitioning defective 3 homolog [Centruroides sculpturatus]|uniref:partitioning defective 3 homolog n=1 Tax=Centruroides sculpturatus TaxID=218467 RepID=UPI000C6D2742|nr:partitioning defective 3 homolog [Centruroides sculpturatus]
MIINFLQILKHFAFYFRDKGLIIQGIEKGGRIYHDGRISVGDCIMEINGHRLCEVSFQTAQEIFKKALDANEIKLSLLKGLSHFPSNVSKKLPPPVYPKPILQTTNNNLKEQKDENLPSSTKSHIHSVNTLTSNTRKIGKKIHIQLKKGCYGLGFSVTTRDNPAGKNCPIYIKNILPKGSAIEDGKLKPGDRLLEVNGLEVTGKSQDEVVTMLRSIPQDEIANLLISRQISDATSPSPNLPRKLPTENTGEEEYGLLSKHREIITLEIPLNDTGSAGLGVSVKGKTSTINGHSTDLGIFVKSVIHGGAASKDGRLQSNDQLININGISLLKMTNTQAMETLRRAMTQGDAPNPNAILLTIARRISSYENLDGCHQRSDSIISGSGESDGSATIICGNFGIFSAQSNNNFSDSKKLDNTSDHNNILESSVYRKYSLPSRHPVIDYLMGQTPKSDCNLSANLSECESLVTSGSPNNTSVKKIIDSTCVPNSEKHRKFSAPGHLTMLSTKNNQIKNETPELNRKVGENFDSQ